MQPNSQTYNQTQDVAQLQNRVLRNTYLLLAVSMVPKPVSAANEVDDQ